MQLLRMYHPLLIIDNYLHDQTETLNTMIIAPLWAGEITIFIW